MVGVNDNDLDILIVKGFVIRFHSGVIVITHWKRNNLIRKDWYRETVFLEEKDQLECFNGRYIFVNEIAPGMLTQNRIGKVNETLEDRIKKLGEEKRVS